MSFAPFYHVVMSDGTIQEWDTFRLSRMPDDIYAISTDSATARYNAALCLEAAIKRHRNLERPGIGDWWLKDLRTLEARIQKLHTEAALG